MQADDKISDTKHAGLPAEAGSLLAVSQHNSSGIPGSLSPSISKRGFPTNPLASTGSAASLIKARSSRAPAAADAGSGLQGDGAHASTSKAGVSSTISRAKEALAKAKARAAAGGSLAGAVSSTRVLEGAISDKPFTLYGSPTLPPPKPVPNISRPDADEAARRRWGADLTPEHRNTLVKQNKPMLETAACCVALRHTWRCMAQPGDIASPML